MVVRERIYCSLGLQNFREKEENLIKKWKKKKKKNKS